MKKLTHKKFNEIAQSLGAVEPQYYMANEFLSDKQFKVSRVKFTYRLEKSLIYIYVSYNGTCILSEMKTAGNEISLNTQEEITDVIKLLEIVRSLMSLAPYQEENQLS